MERKERMGRDFYTRRRSRLLRQFDVAFKMVRSQISSEYGDEFAEKVITNARREYEEMIPQLPYVGGRGNTLTPIIYFSGWLVSLHRAMETRGLTPEDAVRVFFEAIRQALLRIPRPARRLLGRFMNSRFFVNRMKKMADKSQLRLHPGDWVFTLEEGNLEDYRWRAEYSECAVCKIFIAQEAEPLLPYCWVFDILISHLCGAGIVVEETIGEGGDRCIATFKYGREIPLPEWMRSWMQ